VWLAPRITIMKTNSFLSGLSARLSVGMAVVCGSVLIFTPAVRAAKGDASAVLSSVSTDYARMKQADGKFAPEYYSFGEGGLSGAMKGDDISNLKFLDLARVFARTLMEQNYLPAGNANEAKLLIMVYWGTTNVDATGSASANPGLSITTEMSAPAFVGVDSTNGSIVTQSRVTADHNSSMSVAEIEEGKRVRALEPTARLLGYYTALTEVSNAAGGLQNTRREELLHELEQQRYFVLLQAFDFQLAHKEKKMKLLWETRFSITRMGNEFRDVVPLVARYASRYYGQDSHGLKRKRLQGSAESSESPSTDMKPEKK